MSPAKVLLAVPLKVFEVELKIALFEAGFGYINLHVVLKHGVYQLSNRVGLIMEVRAEQEQVVEIEHPISVNVQQLKHNFLRLPHSLPFLIRVADCAFFHPEGLKLHQKLFETDWL